MAHHRRVALLCVALLARARGLLPPRPRARRLTVPRASPGLEVTLPPPAPVPWPAPGSPEAGPGGSAPAISDATSTSEPASAARDGNPEGFHDFACWRLRLKPARAQPPSSKTFCVAPRCTRGLMRAYGTRSARPRVNGSFLPTCPGPAAPPPCGFFITGRLCPPCVHTRTRRRPRSPTHQNCKRARRSTQHPAAAASAA